MNRRTFLSLCAAGSAAMATHPTSPAFATDEPAGWAKSFYLMDTWFWLEKELTIPQQTELFKKLGYAGLALSWGSKHAERLAALKENGLETPGCYITVNIDDGYPDALGKCVELMKGTRGRIWMALTSKKFKKSEPAGDEAALKIITQCAEACKAADVLGIALYPHVGMWQEKVSDAVRLAAQAKRTDVGLQFNQYHWMVADGGLDLRKNLDTALPYLKSVSINGSALKASILPLSEGEYDVLPILKTLQELKFTGVISHQGYSIQGNLSERLTAAKAKWEKLRADAQS